jgi:uncharacterized membrane protein YeiH
MVLYTLSLIGVAVFGVSGALTAGRKHYDWVGVTVIAFVTALGGGTLRDILLNRGQTFWMQDPAYIWVILAACFATLFFVGKRKVPYKTLLIADALGLALFSISGAQIAEQSGASYIVVILMGSMTGAAGGVMRDILTGETPVLFRSDEPLYSIASILGVTTYLVLKICGLEQNVSALIGISVVTAVRFAAIFWNIRLPAFKLMD